jgi:tetratricopeptide (TPR) repeat protein
MRTFYQILLNCVVIVFASGVSAQDSDFNAKMKNAAEMLTAKQYSEAQSFFKEALKQAAKPDERQKAVRGVADCLNAQNKFVEAAEVFKSNLMVFEGADATYNAYGMIASSLNRANEAGKALEWQLKRLGIDGISPEQRASTYLQIGDLQREKMRKPEDAGKSYAEAVKIYESIIADSSSKDNVKADARVNRIGALSKDSSRRGDYFKAADEFVSSQDALLDRKGQVFEQMKNVYIDDHDWKNAASCLRRYAELPGLAPAKKASVLLQLGDLSWRNCHNLGVSLKALREVVAIHEAPAKTKQDAETWIRMLSEQY